MTRRHDIDALRAIAFALLILYHLAMFYVLDWGWHVKSVHQAEWLQWPMLFVNRWRMDLIFLVSGIAAAFLLKEGQAWRFVRQRSWRLFVPLLFGMLVIVPIQPYAQGVSNGLVETGFGRFLIDYFGGRQWAEDAFDGWDSGLTWNHLWYLAYLWMYTLALGLLSGPMASRTGKRLVALFTGLRGPALLVLPAVPLIVYTLALQERFPDDGDFINDWYRNAVYFTVFLYGFMIARADGFWAEARRLRLKSTALALWLFAPYVTLVALLPADLPAWQQAVVWTLRNLYIWAALMAILGWASTRLDKPFRWLPWANESVYPWYLLHQSLIVGLGFALSSLGLGPIVEPLVLLAGTVAGCWAITAMVRRVSWLRPLFGLKPAPKQASRTLRRVQAAVAPPAQSIAGPGLR